MLIRTLVGLGAFSLASAALAVPLWQNVEAGMTRSQVQKAQPSARAEAASDTLGDGARCELSIPSLTIGTDSYKVCFFIKDGKLEQVMLSALRPSEPGFQSVVALLRAKYGPEIGAGQPLCSEDSILKKCNVDWLLKSGVNVSATMLQVGANDPIFNIVYQTRMAKDTSKL